MAIFNSYVKLPEGKGKPFFSRITCGANTCANSESIYLINFNHPYSMHSLSIAQSLFCMTRQLGCRHKPGGSNAQSSGVWIEIGVPTSWSAIKCLYLFGVFNIQHSSTRRKKTIFMPEFCQNFEVTIPPLTWQSKLAMSLMEGRCRMSGGSHACHGHGISRSPMPRRHG